MKQLTTYIALALMMFLASCSNDEDVQRIDLPTDDMWVEEDLEGASVTIKPFIAGDAVTRSSLVFGNQSLVFGWSKNDIVGIYPTAMDVSMIESKDGLLDPTKDENNKHVYYDQNHNLWRTDPEKAAPRSFSVRDSNGSQTTNISNQEDQDFEWDESGRWTAYFPLFMTERQSYVAYPFEFCNQIQNGLVNISAYKKGTAGDKTIGDSNVDYRQSEISACQHLSERDVMISPEMAWNGSKINFQMRHVGAVIRLYLLAPKEKENLIIDNIKLICDSKIFFEKGEVSLISHPYVNDREHNYGVDLNTSSPDCQIKPTGPATNMLQLTFGQGSAKTIYDASDSYKRYITAYIMTFPVTYDPAIHGNLFAYVTAHKEGDSSEYHFVSKPLEGKTMESGHYYQFTSSTHADDGLYPIELTATLLPWQDIVGSGINADLEK